MSFEPIKSSQIHWETADLSNGLKESHATIQGRDVKIITTEIDLEKLQNQTELYFKEILGFLGYSHFLSVTLKHEAEKKHGRESTKIINPKMHRKQETKSKEIKRGEQDLADIIGKKLFNRVKEASVTVQETPHFAKYDEIISVENKENEFTPNLEAEEKEAEEPIVLTKKTKENQKTHEKKAYDTRKKEQIRQKGKERKSKLEETKKELDLVKEAKRKLLKDYENISSPDDLKILDKLLEILSEQEINLHQKLHDLTS